MKRSKCIETQIETALKESEPGKAANTGINKQTFYDRKKKYSGMDFSKLAELKALKVKSTFLERAIKSTLFSFIILVLFNALNIRSKFCDRYQIINKLVR